MSRGTGRPRRIPSTEYERGEIAIVTVDTRAWRSRGSGSRTLRAGTRLIVIKPGRDYLHARIEEQGQTGYVWTLDARTVAPEDREVRYLGDAPEGAISADDPRLDYLWRDAAIAADIAGLCPDYDRLCEALGIPGRERSFAVRLEVAPGVQLSGTFTARSYAEAERMLLRTTTANLNAPLALEAARTESR